VADRRPLPQTYGEWLERAREQQARFFGKIRVIAGGCHLWQAGKDKDGYGKFQITGRGKRSPGDRPVQKHVRAHRLAWELRHGPVPPGLVLRHSCDTEACCNPEHLAPGTQGENRADCVRRGREPRGVQKPQATITEEKVREIRSLAATGLRAPDIARRAGVTRAVADQILRRKTWRHVA
jgi:HNH endonuclease